MRKASVLALVLVFAIAGAAFAAPSFSGNVTLTAESAGSFTGPFALSPSVRVDTDFAEEGENWTLDARLRSTWAGAGNVDVAVNRYRGVFNGDGFTATVARGYGLGNIDTPYAWVRLASNPGDRIRITTDVAGIDVAAQLQGDDYLYLRAQTDSDFGTVGTGIALNLDDTTSSNYTGYLTTSLDIMTLRAIVGSFAGDTDYAVGVSADLTEQLNVGATYASATRGGVTEGFAVNGTFTEGVLQAKASYAQDNSAVKASLVYRGSEDNLAFGDLFDHGQDAWEDHWHTNVAPAFGVSYSDSATAAAATIEVDGVFPVADNFAARAHFSTQGNDTEYALEGRVVLTDKTTLNVYFEKDMADVNTIGAKARYAVGEGASITVTAERDNNVDSLVAAYSISF